MSASYSNLNSPREEAFGQSAKKPRVMTKLYCELEGMRQEAVHYDDARRKVILV